MPITSSPLHEHDEHDPGKVTPFRASDLFRNAVGSDTKLPSTPLPDRVDDPAITRKPVPVESTEAGPPSLDAGTQPQSPLPDAAADSTAGDAGASAETEANQIEGPTPPDVAVEAVPRFEAPVGDLLPDVPAIEPETARLSQPVTMAHVGADLPDSVTDSMRDPSDAGPGGSSEQPTPAEAAPLADNLAGPHAFESAPQSAAVGTGVAVAPPPLPEFHAGPKEGGRSLSSALDAVPLVEFPPTLADTRPELTPPPSAPLQPLANAYGATAKLAADATAAAEALENLKRLLERQLPNPAQTPRQPARERLVETAVTHDPSRLPRQEDESAARVPEMPEHRPQPAGEKPLPRPRARKSSWRERRQFDFRGFMAGFALSWAIGAVLYIYLTAG